LADLRSCASRDVQALKDLGHEVDLYATYLDKRAWEVITNGMGDVPESTVLGEPPINRLFRRAQILRALSTRAREVAKNFSYERFKTRLNEVINSEQGSRSQMT